MNSPKQQLILRLQKEWDDLDNIKPSRLAKVFDVTPRTIQIRIVNGDFEPFGGVITVDSPCKTPQGKDRNDYLIPVDVAFRYIKFKFSNKRSVNT